MEMNLEQRAEQVVETLNGWLKNDPFWEEEFECKAEEIVEQFGFGTFKDKETGEVRIGYIDGDDIVRLLIPIEQLEKIIKRANTQVERRQAVLFVTIFGEGEDEECDSAVS